MNMQDNTSIVSLSEYKGAYGGTFVPETLIPVLEEVIAAFQTIAQEKNSRRS